MKNYIDILKSWNLWGRVTINTGIKRPKYLNKIVAFLDMPEVIAVSGVRRSGKSTLMQQTIKYLHQHKKLPFENALYVNFEDPEFGEKLKATDLFEIVEQYRRALKPKGKIYLFLDEIQQVSKWEKFVRTIYDQQQEVKVFVSGSSSGIFESKLSTVLSGRMVAVKIKPLDFKEFLSFKGIKKVDAKIYRFLDEYLKYGGFPRVVLEQSEINKKAILVTYYNTIIEKDIINRHQIRQQAELKQLARLIFSNIGNLASSYRLEKVLRTHHDTIQNYLGYLHDAYLIDLIPRFSYSVKTQIYNPDKIFAIDPGLVNTAGFSFSENKGKFLENMVYQYIEEQSQDVFYWKNETEIDLVTRVGVNVDQLINVTLTVDEPDVLARELKSLETAKKHFGKKVGSSLFTLYNQSSVRDPRVKNILEMLLK